MTSAAVARSGCCRSAHASHLQTNTAMLAWQDKCQIYCICVSRIEHLVQ